MAEWAEPQTGSATGETSPITELQTVAVHVFVNEEPNLGFGCDVSVMSPLWMVASPWQQAPRLTVNVVCCILN